MKLKTIIIHNIFMLICMIALVELLISPFASGKAGEWAKKRDVPVQTAWFPTVEFNGKIYLFDFGAGTWEYDPETDTWTPKSGFTSRGDHAAVLVNGRVYVTDDRGGMYEYNPTTDKWAKKANSQFDKRSTPLSAVNGKVYAIGGITVADNVTLSVVQEYNPITDTWTRKKDLPFPLAWPSACTVGDKIYVFGGWDGGGTRTTVMEYDPSVDEWTKKADMTTGRVFLPKSAPVINGKVYVIGGYQNTALSVTEIYDLKTDTWTKGPDMPTPRFALSTTAVKGKIYTFGGCLGANFVAQTWTKTVEVYDTGETFHVRAYGKITTTWAALKK